MNKKYDVSGNKRRMLDMVPGKRSRPQKPAAAAKGTRKAAAATSKPMGLGTAATSNKHRVDY